MNKKIFFEKISPILPHAPGCYMFLDIEGNVLYVGKSKSLKKRVASYFGNNKYKKFGVMLRFTNSIAIEETRTDIEALLLEHRLIKKHRPQYNSKMRKDYQKWYIKFDEHLLITPDTNTRGFFVGPFSHKETAIEALEILGKCFKLPTCNNAADKVTRMCLRGHMNNCFAPCENKEFGMENYQHAIRFLQGNHEDALDEIQKKMQLAIQKMEYEQASLIKAQYEDLKKLSNFAANSTPILTKKQYVVYLKSRHEDCFMLVYLDDGECHAKVLVEGLHETDKFSDFANEIILLSKGERRPENGTFSSGEESEAFTRALVEISAIRRFYEVDKNFMHPRS